MSHRLTLYTRSGCSLCEVMQGELAAMAAFDAGFSVDLVDIDSEEHLKQAYGHKVPVLAGAGGEEICHYFLDQQALDAYFSKH